MWWWLLLSLAMASDPEPPAEPPPLPGLRLSGDGLAMQWSGVGLAGGGGALRILAALGQSQTLGDFSLATVGAGGALNASGALMTTIGQRRAIAALAADGIDVPRGAKLGGDVLALTGWLLIGGFGIAAATPAGRDSAATVPGLLAGGGISAIATVPWAIQQGILGRAADRRPGVHVAWSPSGVYGQF